MRNIRIWEIRAIKGIRVRIDDDTRLKQGVGVGDNIENEIEEYAIFRAR